MRRGRLVNLFIVLVLLPLTTDRPLLRIDEARFDRPGDGSPGAPLPSKIRVECDQSLREPLGCSLRERILAVGDAEPDRPTHLLSKVCLIWRRLLENAEDDWRSSCEGVGDGVTVWPVCLAVCAVTTAVAPSATASQRANVYSDAAPGTLLRPRISVRSPPAVAIVAVRPCRFESETLAVADLGARRT